MTTTVGIPSADGQWHSDQEDIAVCPQSSLKRLARLHAKRANMRHLKGTATVRHFDDLDNDLYPHPPQHIDPRELVCDQCNTTASYCCAGQCAPPTKRRATSIEVDRLNRSLSPIPSCDDASLYDMVDECCFQSCDDRHCPEAATIPCTGDDHCPSKTACADPKCEGAPCFQDECGSPPCTEPACPDKTCKEGEPCMADGCQFDPWDCCDLLHPNEDFLNPSFYDDHWAQFHPNQPFEPQFPSNVSSSLQQSNVNQSDLTSNQHSDINWYTAPSSMPQMAPTMLDAAGNFNSLEPHLSAAEGLALFQNSRSNFTFQAPDAPMFPGSSSRQSHSDQAGFQSYDSAYQNLGSSTISPRNSTGPPNSSYTPSTTAENSKINSPNVSECHTPLYGFYPGMNPKSLTASASPVMPIKTEPRQDVESQLTCKWLLPGTHFVCNHQSASPSDLQSHIRDVHVKTMKGALKCQWYGCRNDNDFKQRSKLTRHVQTHAGYRPHVCTWPGCGQSFGTKQTMDNHLKTHEQVKPYKCRYCDVTATTPTQIKTHENSVHLCRKRFRCRFCEFACTDSSNLSKHEKTHRKRTFKCLHPGCAFKPDCRWENAKRHFMKSGHCPELLVKGSEAQERYKKEAMAAASIPDEEVLGGQLRERVQRLKAEP
ncbi:hypothetical protein EJ05DRAFT_472911 [Pseudovirgaria hyperparasitica]|uniref:C2H2-type domain-containing protein n=1 Tax=Pseudovirgaria hyperparasitica TaxID=470096 RepID=A0A6A6WGM8_9PEZI|nr:uncharacterized protein EJ05DRAFT_472911 [Pseudovirgaria hyperparasitica]KAF2761968.1 hypothetical protein EJ05DRAFT_472911 [Pseudovirgaria hyperparasitica]